MTLSPELASVPSMLSSRYLLAELTQRGFVKVPLDLSQVSALENLCDRSDDFFGMSYEAKARFSVPDYTVGYRPAGKSHGGDPSKPDRNEAFLDWENRTAPNAGQMRVREFLASIDAYRRMVAAPIAGKLITELCELYGREPFGFRQRSVMQINHFGEASDGAPEDVLQTPHDDWTLATILWTSAPGLWLINDGRRHAPTTDVDEVLILAGGALAVMTADAIPAGIHEVRAGGGSARKSFAYFVNSNKAVSLARGVSPEKVEAAVQGGVQTFGWDGFYDRQSG